MRNYALSPSHLESFDAQNGNKGVPNAFAIILIAKNFVNLLRRTRVHVCNCNIVCEGRRKNQTNERTEEKQ